MSERENQEMNEPKTDDYRYRWNYGDQCAYEAKKQNKNKRRGAWIYAIVMFAAFAACIALLIGMLVWYYAGGKVEEAPTDHFETVSAVAEKVTPSTVLIYASNSTTYGYGTGFFIRSDGYIATNYHVVAGKNNIRVTLYSGEVATATLVGYSEHDDLAVLKIAGTGYPAVTIGDSDALRVGELAVAIGNPSGENASWSTTHGIISALDREVTVSGQGSIKEITMIQTDAPVNPGNSGGPLCNAKGEVIGIVTRKFTEYEGMGLALPINGATEILDAIVKTGSADGVESSLSKVRPTIGISVVDVVAGDKYTSNGYDYEAQKTGVLIAAVQSGGAAEGILQVRDIIIAIDYQRVETQAELAEILYGYEIGDEIKVTVWRGNSEITRTIRLGTAEN